MILGGGLRRVDEEMRDGGRLLAFCKRIFLR